MSLTVVIKQSLSFWRVMRMLSLHPLLSWFTITCYLVSLVGLRLWDDVYMWHWLASTVARNKVYYNQLPVQKQVTPTTCVNSDRRYCNWVWSLAYPQEEAWHCLPWPQCHSNKVHLAALGFAGHQDQYTSIFWNALQHRWEWRLYDTVGVSKLHLRWELVYMWPEF